MLPPPLLRGQRDNVDSSDYQSLLRDPALILQQHQQVIHQIRCLVGQLKAVILPSLPVRFPRLLHLLSAQCVWPPLAYSLAV